MRPRCPFAAGFRLAICREVRARVAAVVLRRVGGAVAEQRVGVIAIEGVALGDRVGTAGCAAPSPGRSARRDSDSKDRVASRSELRATGGLLGAAASAAARARLRRRRRSRRRRSAELAFGWAWRWRRPASGRLPLLGGLRGSVLRRRRGRRLGWAEQAEVGGDRCWPNRVTGDRRLCGDPVCAMDGARALATPTDPRPGRVTGAIPTAAHVTAAAPPAETGGGELAAGTQARQLRQQPGARRPPPRSRRSGRWPSKLHPPPPSAARRTQTDRGSRPAGRDGSAPPTASGSNAALPMSWRWPVSRPTNSAQRPAVGEVVLRLSILLRIGETRGVGLQQRLPITTPLPRLDQAHALREVVDAARDLLSVRARRQALDQPTHLARLQAPAVAEHHHRTTPRRQGDEELSSDAAFLCRNGLLLRRGRNGVQNLRGLVDRRRRAPAAAPELLARLMGDRSQDVLADLLIRQVRLPPCERSKRPNPGARVDVLDLLAGERAPEPSPKHRSGGPAKLLK